MVYFALFMLLSLLELASLVLAFFLRDTLHAVLSVSVAFLVSSLLFLVMEQPLIALVQMFVMVGGIATYLIVGVTSVDVPRSRHTNPAVLALLAIALFAAVYYYSVAGIAFSSVQGNLLSSQAVAQDLSSNMALLYTLSLMLFGIGIGTIVLLRKIG